MSRLKENTKKKVTTKFGIIVLYQIAILLIVVQHDTKFIGLG